MGNYEQVGPKRSEGKSTKNRAASESTVAPRYTDDVTNLMTSLTGCFNLFFVLYIYIMYYIGRILYIYIYLYIYIMYYIGRIYIYIFIYIMYYIGRIYIYIYICVMYYIGCIYSIYYIGY